MSTLLHSSASAGPDDDAWLPPDPLSVHAIITSLNDANQLCKYNGKPKAINVEHSWLNGID